uniref:C2 calcium dependent domain containing 4A n=1 Tax=Cyprinus carpio TaxID=7962 RepID=A0A8C2IAI7_CYPCA
MWVVEKIRVSVERTNLPLPIAEYSFKIGDIMFGDKSSIDKAKKVLLCPNIITPDTIPEFCIPPKISTPVEGKSMDDEETTNADPQSQAALSLPHLAKAQTCYGFCTLLESPHTRRKESLFHNDPNSNGIPLIPHRSRSRTCSKSSLTSSPILPSSSSTSSFSLNTITSRLSPKGFALHRQGTLDREHLKAFTVIRKSRNPIFNEDFFFDSISEDDLCQRLLRFKVVNKMSSMKRDYILGNCDLPLTSIVTL